MNMGIMTERKYIRKDKMRHYLWDMDEATQKLPKSINYNYVIGYTDAVKRILEYIEDKNDNGQTVTGAEAFAIDVNDYGFNPYANT